MRETVVKKLWLALVCALAFAGVAHAGTISVGWDAVPDAAGYKVYWGTAPGSYTQSKDVPGQSSTSTTLTNLDPCTVYYIGVKAYDAEGLESENYSNEVSGLPRPVVSSLDPASGEQGTSRTLTITGESFADGARVEFSGTGIVVDAVRRDSCTQLSVDVTIAADAATGGRRVEVINPDNSFGGKDNAFTVTANAAPTVSSADPPAGATEVAVTVRPKVVFSETMSAASITTSTVQLRDAANQPVAQAAGSPQLAADGVTATVIPADDLAHEAEYHLWVRGGTSGAKDASGKPMASDWNQSPGFTTSAAPDTEGPSVTGSNPADGAADVPVGVHPTVSFDEELDPASVTASTIQLRDAAGQPVAQASGSPQLSADGRTATIEPAAALGELARYRIHVVGGSAGVKDLAGNGMDSTWEQPNGFETENLPPGDVTNNHRTDTR